MSSLPRTAAPPASPADLAREAAAATVAALHELLEPELQALFDYRFIRSHLLYDEYVTRLALGVVRAAGLEGPLRAGGPVDAIAAAGGLGATQVAVPLGWMLALLAERGHLERDGDGFRAPGPLPSPDPEPVRAEQLRHEPSWAPSYALSETVAQEYPAFLRGELAGEEVLFSPRRLRLWVDYFSNAHGLYAVNNRLGAKAVEAWLPDGAGAVVLELGGGLGSGAAAVLERLEAHGRLGALAEYRFTEFVPAFLRRGQQALESRHPGLAALRFGALDMNRPLGAQGVEPGSVSVVYGVNTLHVADDLDATLAEVHRALRPGGRVIVSECVRPSPGWPIYAEFIFNLMATFRSPRRCSAHRPTGGFLTPGQWTAALEAAGFTDVRLMPDLPRIHARVPDFYAGVIAGTRP